MHLDLQEVTLVHPQPVVDILEHHHHKEVVIQEALHHKADIQVPHHQVVILPQEGMDNNSR